MHVTLRSGRPRPADRVVRSGRGLDERRLGPGACRSSWWATRWPCGPERVRSRAPGGCRRRRAGRPTWSWGECRVPRCAAAAPRWRTGGGAHLARGGARGVRARPQPEPGASRPDSVGSAGERGARCARASVQRCATGRAERLGVAGAVQRPPAGRAQSPGRTGLSRSCRTAGTTSSSSSRRRSSTRSRTWSGPPQRRRVERRQPAPPHRYLGAEPATYLEHRRPVGLGGLHRRRGRTRRPRRPRCGRGAARAARVRRPARAGTIGRAPRGRGRGRGRRAPARPRRTSPTPGRHGGGGPGAAACTPARHRRRPARGGAAASARGTTRRPASCVGSSVSGSGSGEGEADGVGVGVADGSGGTTTGSFSGSLRRGGRDGVNVERGSSRQVPSAMRSSTQATTSLPLTTPSLGIRAPMTTRAGTRSRVATSAIAAAYCSSSPTMCGPFMKSSSRARSCPRVNRTSQPNAPSLYLPRSRIIAAARSTASIRESALLAHGAGPVVEEGGGVVRRLVHQSRGPGVGGQLGVGEGGEELVLVVAAEGPGGDRGGRDRVEAQLAHRHGAREVDVQPDQPAGERQPLAVPRRRSGRCGSAVLPVRAGVVR